MQQLIAPHQTLLGVFSNLSSAEAAVDALQKTDFPEEKLTIMPQILQPTPAMQDTEVKRSTGGGALAGTVFGSMAGLLLGVMNVVSPNDPQVDAVQVVTGMLLAGAAVGAAGGSLIGMLSGLKVPKGAADPNSDQATNYVVVAEQVTSDQVIKAKELLKQMGSTLEA